MAFESCLTDWLEGLVLFESSSLLVLDKPHGVPVHGGRDGDVSDVVGRVSRWLERRGQPSYLGVHQRLDLATSGVLALSRTPAVARRLAPLFEQHRTERRYLAVVTDPGLPTAGAFEDHLLHERGVTRVVPRGGLLARSRYRVLARHAGRALVELLPETGRTHQLRVQLAARGAPIAGDRLYGGAPWWRLCLHAEALTLEGQRFTAPLPATLRECFEGRAPSLPEQLAQPLQLALWRRWGLERLGDAHRWVNELGDGLPGVVVDRYGDFAVLCVSTPDAAARAPELAQALVELGARGVYLKQRARADLRRLEVRELASPTPLVGAPAPEPLRVREGEQWALVSLGDGLSTGLFVDQRDNRARVREWARGERVLNLFSYTCSFSVAAALGGATEVTSVDLAGRALERGRENFRANALDEQRHRFVRRDAVEWLRGAARRGERWGLVVIDPPSFATVGQRSFSVTKDYAALLESAFQVTRPGGRILAVTNHRGTSEGALRALLRRAAAQAGVAVESVKSLAPGADCPSPEEGPSPSKSAVAVVSPAAPRVVRA